MHTISWEQAQRAGRPVLVDRPATGVLVRSAASTVLALVLGGALSAVLWSQLADPPMAQVQAARVLTGGDELTRQFGMDVTFAWTSALPALPIGALVGALWHRHGWVQAVAVMLGGIAAGLLAWRLGMVLGPGELADRLPSASVGDRLPNALQLDSLGLLLSAAVAALVGFVLGVAFFATGDLDNRAHGEIAEPPGVDPPPG
ncbi:MAG: hypothetical protein M3419_02710 [Actinomycetota bacterium]|nr:hypothetical protein [Actinomycetota bacterium]